MIGLTAILDRRIRDGRGTHSVACVALALLASGLLAGSALGNDQLSQQDHDDLIYHLNIIAADSGWPQNSINAANAILADEQYSATAWDTFFTEYFTDYPFRDYLEWYLGYPVFWWFSDTVHTNLQTGLHGPLLLVNVDPDWATAAAAGGSVFAGNQMLREDLENSLKHLTWFGTHGDVSGATKQAIFDHLTTLINSYPTILRKNVTFDRAAEPYFAILRAQVYTALMAAAQNLDAPTRAQIGSTLNLTGLHADIWNDQSCLLLDNNLTNSSQRQFIYDYLASVPASAHNVRSITINDYLGNSTTYQDVTIGIARPYGGVNIFGVPIGGYSENSFPPDVSPGYVDGYCVVVAHEVNHVVDAYYVQGDPVLAARRQALLDAAGYEHMQYLRSMFDDDFFQNSPQEFIASIANQWFTDSAKTVELGLVRFDAGWHEPINQGLFFAEIYSLGGDSTLFYTINTAGDQTRETIPLERDANGHINVLVFDDTRYEFETDADGNVTAYSSGPACPGDFSGDGDVDLADLANLLAHYGWVVGATYHDGDMDGDGDVDLQDLAAFLSGYGADCP